MKSQCHCPRIWKKLEIEEMRTLMSLMVLSANRRYCLYASLDQRPMIWMTESGIPADAAAEAPPIRNEWVLMLWICGNALANKLATN